jgi:hypothetical protein
MERHATAVTTVAMAWGRNSSVRYTVSPRRMERAIRADVTSPITVGHDREEEHEHQRVAERPPDVVVLDRRDVVVESRPTRRP